MQLADKVVGKDEFAIEDLASIAGLPALAAHEYHQLGKELQTGYKWELKNGKGPAGLTMRRLVKTNQPITKVDAVMKYFKFLPVDKREKLKQEIYLRTTPQRQRKEELKERKKDRINAAKMALRSMREKQMMPEGEDPGMALAHNIGLQHPGVPAGAAAAAGTARNMISPTATINAVWEMLFGPKRQGHIMGGDDAVQMAENPENL